MKEKKEAAPTPASTGEKIFEFECELNKLKNDLNELFVKNGIKKGVVGVFSDGEFIFSIDVDALSGL